MGSSYIALLFLPIVGLGTGYVSSSSSISIPFRTISASTRISSISSMSSSFSFALVSSSSFNTSSTRTL